MKKCPKLYEYSLFIEEIRTNHKKGMGLREAVELAVDSCIEKGILKEILLGNKAEVTEMILQEYDEKLHIANEKEISYQEGLEQGRQESERARQESERAREEEKLRGDIFFQKLDGRSDIEIAENLGISIEKVKDVLGELKK